MPKEFNSHFRRSGGPDDPSLVDPIDDGDAFVISYKREPSSASGTFKFYTSDGGPYLVVGTRYDGASKDISLSVPGVAGAFHDVQELSALKHVIMIVREGDHVSLSLNGRWLGSTMAAMLRIKARFSGIAAEWRSGTVEPAYKLVIFKGPQAKSDAEECMRILSSDPEAQPQAVVTPQSDGAEREEDGAGEETAERLNRFGKIWKSFVDAMRKRNVKTG